MLIPQQRPHQVLPELEGVQPKASDDGPSVSAANRVERSAVPEDQGRSCPESLDRSCPDRKVRHTAAKDADCCMGPLRSIRPLMPRGGRLPVWVASLLPGGHGVVLVVQPDQPGREPPLDQSTERGSTAPAIRVAATLAIPRVMDLLQNATCHVTSVAPPLASPAPEARTGGNTGRRAQPGFPMSVAGRPRDWSGTHTSGIAGGRSSDSAGRVLPLLPQGGRVKVRSGRRHSSPPVTLLTVNGSASMYGGAPRMCPRESIREEHLWTSPTPPSGSGRRGWLEGGGRQRSALSRG